MLKIKSFFLACLLFASIFLFVGCSIYETLFERKLEPDDDTIALVQAQASGYWLMTNYTYIPILILHGQTFSTFTFTMSSSADFEVEIFYPDRDTLVGSGSFSTETGSVYTSVAYQSNNILRIKIKNTDVEFGEKEVMFDAEW